jgi:hypothetical protein
VKRAATDIYLDNGSKSPDENEILRLADTPACARESQLVPVRD